ncbi:Glutamate receptor 2.6 [Dichanthelium oligosanthes]|uniref:Glutamate receptor 2.6 n=1 Tax=Dichanthelium oligosanthes TaxID=888268 RepID=A0A1E5VFD3_9POAL|nr:Glutamate receptor 2.6 [Dichanthelium oligosanthes]
MAAAGEPAYSMAALHASGSRGDTTIHQLPKSEDATVRREYVKLIAVPQKHVFKDFVNVAIDIFKVATEKLESPLCYVLCAFNGTYDELVQTVSKMVFDGAVGDVTITDDRVKIADFTMPYAPSGVSLLVLADDDSKPPIQWIFLKPLTKELWITTVGFFFFTGFVVWVIEWPRNPVYQGSSAVSQFATASYFAFSTLTFSHGQIIRSPLSKVVVVIWCFAVLLLVQSYTANLSSMLTAKRLRPSVTGLDQLVSNGDYIGYQEGAFVHSFLRNKGAKEENLRTFKNQTEYAEALRKGSKNGGVSAIVDEIPYLSYFLSDKNNKEFEMGERLYKTPGLGFVSSLLYILCSIVLLLVLWTHGKEIEADQTSTIPFVLQVFPRGSPLVHNLSVAILNLTGGNESSRIEQEWLGSAALLKGDSSPIADSAPLTLRSFSGLFVITGCVSGSMAIISIAKLVYAKYFGVRASETHSADRNGECGHLGEFSALQNNMGNGYVHDQRIQEARDNDSQVSHGNGRSTDDEEAGPMQDSMSNGSVPEVFVQIEMSNTSQGVDRAL